jgi:hypothetical protein
LLYLLYLVPLLPLLFLGFGFAIGVTSKEKSSKFLKYLLLVTVPIVAAYLVVFAICVFFVLTSSDPYIIVILPAFSVFALPFVPVIVFALLHVGGALGVLFKNRQNK